MGQDYNERMKTLRKKYHKHELHGKSHHVHVMPGRATGSFALACLPRMSPEESLFLGNLP